ncbi:MAG: STAS domain-containing protein [Actinomycetota bacterium]
MSELEVRREQPADGVIVVALVGELDLSTAEEVDSELASAELEDPRVLALDLQGTTFLDSTGLRTVIRADEERRRKGRRLAVLPGPENVKRIFSLTGLDEQLWMVADRGDLLTTS